jgi:tight adherence protein C
MNLLVVAVGIGLLLTFFLLFLLVGRRSAQSVLLEQVTDERYQSLAGDNAEKRWGALSAEALARPLGWLRGLFAPKPNPELVKRLMLAGYRKRFHADVYVGVRLVLPVVVGLAVALWVKNNVFLWFVLAVVIAFFLPEFWLARAIRKRREDIRLSLPDALDLLAICMEAGLGLDQAIVRIGQELKISHRAISEEFLQINLEQRAGNPRIGAWRNMADRAGVESVRSFVNMLVQTERFGTPISKSLGDFSAALRTQRRQQAEERAAKTTIKLVLPLVFFIFPSIFIVTVVPAVLTIMKSFGTII